MNVSYVSWDIGAHTGFNSSIYNCLLDGIRNGMYTVQFFLGNPKAFDRCHPTNEDIEKAKKLIKRFPLNIFIHTPYIFNLAGSKNNLAWLGTPQDNKTKKVLSSLEHELQVLSNFSPNKTGVVVHPGNHVNRNDGLRAIAQSINKINFPGGSKLLLENSAGQGTSLATTFEEIKEIYDRIDVKKQEYVGVCLDTAHMFGYGLYDLSKVEEVKNMFRDFDKIIGIKKLCLVHLNDSQVPLGSKKDRHANIGTGYIWGESMDSLMYLLDKCKELKIPLVLETTIGDMKTIAGLN